MSNNFFSEENDDETFRDIPDEVVEGQQAPPAQVRQAQQPRPQAPVQQAPQPQYEEPQYEEAPTDEEEDFSAVLNDARFRLEQGRLYELVMNNNLFEGAYIEK